MSPLPCSARAVSALPYSANRHYCIILPIARPAECKQYNPAAQRAQASPSTLLYLKQIASALHSTFRRVVAACHHCRVPRTSVITLHNLIPRTAEAHLLLRSTRCHSEPPRMRRVEESTKAAEKQLLCNNARIPINKLYCYPARSFDFVPRYSLGTSLRMTGRAACRRYRIPRKCVITLPSLTARTYANN